MYHRVKPARKQTALLGYAEPLPGEVSRRPCVGPPGTRQLKCSPRCGSGPPSSEGRPQPVLTVVPFSGPELCLHTRTCLAGTPTYAPPAVHPHHFPALGSSGTFSLHFPAAQVFPASWVILLHWLCPGSGRGSIHAGGSRGSNMGPRD